MPRAVGDSKTYPIQADLSFTDSAGEQRHIGTMRFDAPSISTIAKVFDTKSGALTGWAFKSAIEGMQALEAQGLEWAALEYEDLYATLKAQGYTPFARRGRAASRGNFAHDLLEKLARGEYDLQTALAYIENMLPTKIVLTKGFKVEDIDEVSGYCWGVWNFWNENELRVFLSEVQVAGLHPRPFAGTLDLYALRPHVDAGPRRRLTDLKTAKGVYPETIIQLDGYDSGLRQSHPDLEPPQQHSVLLARADGSYEEIIVPSFPAVWDAAVIGYYASTELQEALKGRSQ